MFTTVSNIWKVQDLRRRILFTLFVLLIYRIGAFIPVPGVDTETLKAAGSTGEGLMGLLNTFSGGALFNFSIFAIGITPYITASIIVQLLSMDVIPKFAEWAKQGEEGKKKSAQVTRYGTVILGLIQGLATAIGFNNMYGIEIIHNANFVDYLVIAIILTAGTAFLMWLGEQITEKGIGNGISIIIFAAIVAGLPGHIRTIYVSELATDATFMNYIKVILILLVVILMIVGVIFIQQGIRKIPVQYAKRVVGRKMYGGQSTHIPMKVNGAGVIPVIFAISLLTFPTTIANFFADKVWAKWTIENMSYDAPLGMVLYVLLIVGFTFFYTFVQINPVQMADQMKKNGGYIPGIRPGKPTSSYLTRVLTRITLAGATFLAVISLFPVLFGSLAGLPTSVQLGGTSLLIVVGVALDTMKQIESQLIKRHYKGFINK
ncbi:MAG: preprotein translocase subunit SecY [Candidatus Pristimantibacillus lignocellulolyticus]|uniref:Protein translocase subunit SecY n=1 Tax=Candidatus Pristimantibacillus lignocellulolyticus TaxID=2994561 RepID=A0A9J6ZK55_9BACL|nr:MAG: preprotein translocase subunit SecY [Candidatus Pristimantibacillus lignocellulolyticus]